MGRGARPWHKRGLLGLPGVVRQKEEGQRLVVILVVGQGTSIQQHLIKRKPKPTEDNVKEIIKSERPINEKHTIDNVTFRG